MSKVVSLAEVAARHVTRFDMIGLAASFPSLGRARYFRKVGESFEFDPIGLNRWIRTSPGVGAGSLMAGRFVLQVWNPHTKWTAGRFNVVEALQRWDEVHRAAFLAWARDPWWP